MFFPGREMREQVEVLEHEADLDPPLENLPLLEFVEQVALAPIADVLTVDGDVTGCRFSPGG